jgi:NADH-quinone oxidoreductase subunit N
MFLLNLSIALYILAASDRMNLKVMKLNENFLMGSLHLESFFGICLIYGAMGSFDVIEISALSHC